MGTLEDFKSFIEEVYQRLEKMSEEELSHEAGVALSKGRMFFLDKDFGVFYFTPVEEKKYLKLIDRFEKEYSSDEKLSRTGIEKLLKTALFSSLWRGDDQPKEFNKRLEIAIESLYIGLTKETSIYTVFVPVFGGEKEGLPLVFGDVRFVIYNDNQLRKIKEIKKKKGRNLIQARAQNRPINEIKKTNLWGSLCAIVNVEAKDEGASLEKATRKTKKAVDMLNFLAFFTPYQHGGLFLPGEREQTHKVFPILKGKDFYRIRFDRSKPITNYNFKKLRNDRRAWRIFQKIHKDFKEEETHEVKKAILTGIQWVGKSLLEPNPEQAFLWYFIALEGVIIPKRKEEIRSEIGSRVGKLIGTTKKEEEEVERWLKKLYDIRSLIVHDGMREIAPTDLGRLRSVCLVTMLEVLKSKEIKGINSLKDFEKWYKNR